MHLPSLHGGYMEFDTFIKDLKTSTGLLDLQAASDGSYSLRINQIHFVFLSPSQNPREMFLYAPLCPIPIEENEKLSLFDRLLAANLFGQESGNGWFATDVKSHQILLIDRLALDPLTVTDFLTALNDFVDRLAQWKNNIDHIPKVKQTKHAAFYKI